MNARIPEPCLCGATDCRACHGAMAVPDEPGDDRTLDAIDVMRDLLNDCENAWRNGQKDKAMQCLDELEAEIEEVKA
jgi:hypothetical protein